MRTRKPNSEKLMLSRLKTRLCKVCRVDFIFSHTFINKIFTTKMWETGICTLHTLHTAHECMSADAGKDAFYPAHAAQQEQRGGSGPGRGSAARLAPVLCKMPIFMCCNSPMRDFEVKYVHL